MEVKKVERGAQTDTQPDPAKATIFMLGPDSADVPAQWKDVRYQKFSLDGALPLSSQERRKLDFINFDGNADGRIDFAEYRARNRVMLENGFAQLDEDASGAVNAEEYTALATPLLLIPPDAIPALGITAKYGPVISSGGVDAAFAKLDANNDGKLSREEYLPRP